MSTLPFLSAIVAAKCTVSPMANAESIDGCSRTHAAPRLPNDWCASVSPTTPYEYNVAMMEAMAAPVDATTAMIFPAPWNIPATTSGVCCGFGGLGARMPQ
jgi:hypothetical protein